MTQWSKSWVTCMGIVCFTKANSADPGDVTAFVNCLGNATTSTSDSQDVQTPRRISPAAEAGTAVKLALLWSQKTSGVVLIGRDLTCISCLMPHRIHRHETVMGSSLESHRKLKIACQPDEVQEEVQGFWCLWSKVNASVILSRIQVSLLLFKKTDLWLSV